jgi:exosome complex component RRP42
MGDKIEISKLTKKRIQEYLKAGKRFDGRGLLDLRDIEIQTGVTKNANGSAKVKMGNTEVIAGVKLNTAEPFPDSKGQGILITTAEFLPLSSPRFEPGPPQIDSIELARIVDRGLREGFIEFDKLAINDEKVWGIFVDIYTLNTDGNLIDACALAAVAALKTAVFPKYDEKEDKVEHEEMTTKKLPLTNIIPMNITFYKVGKHIIVDPVEEEEDSSEGRISLAVSNDKEPMIHSLQKGGEDSFTEEEVDFIIDNSVKKTQELLGKIKNLK